VTITSTPLFSWSASSATAVVKSIVRRIFDLAGLVEVRGR